MTATGTKRTGTTCAATKSSALRVLAEHKLARDQEEPVEGTAKKAQRWFAVAAADRRSSGTKYEFNELTA